MPKMNYKTSSDEDLLAVFERGREAEGLTRQISSPGSRQSRWANRLGNRADRAGELLTERGISTDDVDITDYSRGEYDPTELDAVWKSLTNEGTKDFDRSGDERMGFGARRRAQLQNFMQQQDRKKNETFFNEQVDPSLKQAQEIAAKIAETKAVSAEQEMAMRSRISSQYRVAADMNLRRVGALFGQKGLADSPAAVAYTSRLANDLDSDLVGSLRDLGLDVTEMNRQAATQDVGTMASLATARLTARNAALAGDQATTLALQGQMGELIQALGDRRKVIDMLEKAQKEANDESLNDRIGAWVGTAQGVMNLLSSGAKAATDLGIM